MSDVRQALERGVEGVAPPNKWFERMLRRRDRRRRRQRITAAAVGIAFALIAVLVGMSVRPSATVPVKPTRPSTVPTTAPPTPTMHNGPLYGSGFGFVRAYEGGAGGAFVVNCPEHCNSIPDWAWSPDGSRLAFSASAFMNPDGDPYHGLRVVNPATGEDRLLVPGEFLGPIAWSPDGSRIAYVTTGRMTKSGWLPWVVTGEYESWEIRTVSLDGSTDIALLRGQAPVPNSLSWSPDGSRLAYTARGKVFLLQPGGSGPTEVARGTEAAWSPDGRTIAYLAGCDVRLVTPDGFVDRSLIDLRTAAPHCDGAAGLTWSPDGTEFMVMVDRSLGGPKTPSTQALFVVAADGSSARLLGGWSTNNDFGVPAWRPVP